MSSLHDHGFEEISLQDIYATSNPVVSALWKLLSEKQADIRQIGSERENLAKVLNDNKQLRQKNQRLSDQLARAREEMGVMELSFSRKETEWKAKMDDLQRVRLEWEKCAVNYKSREKQYVAELRKQEGEYERLQSRVSTRRSESTVGRISRSPSSFPVNINDFHSNLVGN